MIVRLGHASPVSDWQPHETRLQLGEAGSNPTKRFGAKTTRAAMRANASAAVPFLGIGAAFTAVGASGRNEFLAIGLAFSALGILFLAGKRTVNGPKLASDRDRFDR
jgi:hypothetical protein